MPMAGMLCNCALFTFKNVASLYSENMSIDINVNGVRYSEPCVRLMFAFVINWLSRPLVFTSGWSASQADLFEDGWAEMNEYIHQ